MREQNIRESVLAKLSSDLIFTLDSSGEIISVNPTSLSTLNYEEKEVINTPFNDLIHPDDLMRTKIVLKKAVKTPSQEHTAKIRSKSGEFKPVKWKFAMVEDTVICIGHEVIDIVEKELELKSVLQEVQYVQEALDQYAIVATTDKKGIITYVNQKFCNISGYSKEELIGSDHRILKSGHHPKEFIKDLWDTLKAGEVWRGRIKNKSKEGRNYWVDTTIVPFMDENGEPYRYTAIRFEITDQINLVNNLEEAKILAEQNAAAKDQFLANMSHEIRTPMNAIIGFTDILKTTYLTEEQKEFVDAIGTSGENLLVIINDILDSSKIESNNIHLEQIPINISELLEQIKKVLSLKAAEKQLDLEVNADFDIPNWVMGDPVRLNQILINIANNAIKFTEKGSVRIDCDLIDKSGDECLLEFKVKDTGIGIPKEKLNAVFERFQQAEDYTTRKYGGTGLGLSIAQQLTELFGGQIKVSSKVGVGTQFKIQIPFKISAEAPAHISDGELSIDSLKNLRVLLAEDNLLNQKLAINVMKNLKLDLTVVNNGQEAIDVLKEAEFDIILMDLQMPVMDGHTATTKIINELKLDIPIIAMTAHSLVGEQQKCFDVGMKGFLSKPYKVEDLVRVLNEQNLTVNKSRTVEEAPKVNSSFDMSYLAQISNNDESFIKDAINSVIETIPVTISEIDKSTEERNLDDLKKSMHKIKPTIMMFNHDKIRKLNHTIERSLGFEEVESEIPKLRTLLGEFVTDLKAVS